MRYFKIIQDSKVADVSFTPMKWSEKYGQMVGCSVEKAQFVQGQIGGITYRDGWMRHTDAPEALYEAAEVVETDATEYADLYATLDGGEEIAIDPEEPQIPVVPDVVHTEEEKPMSVSEMRQIIQDQQDRIDMLAELVAQVMAGK